MNCKLALPIFALAFLILGAVAPAPSLAQTPDPSAAGPFAVSIEEYDFGDSAFTPAGCIHPVELRAVVHRPTDLSQGPFPLAIFVHGAHNACYQPGQTAGASGVKGQVGALQWPCPTGLAPIPNYRGYDYIGDTLASNGFIVASISINGVNVFGEVQSERAEIIQKHLDLWRTFNTTGAEPFGSKFVGKVDMSRIGTAGHSASGLGVVNHYQFNLQQPSPYAIGAVLAIAPVSSPGVVINNVPFAVLLSYCDGQVGLNGVHYYDDSRYNQPGDSGPKHAILVMGANHAFYNTIWTPSIFSAGNYDDGTFCDVDPRTARLSDSEQRAAANVYVSAFFRVYLKGDVHFLPLLTGAAPPPSSASFAQVTVSYHPPDNPDQRLDLNRLTEVGNASANSIGGSVSQLGLDPYDLCGGMGEPGNCLPTSSFQIEPHTGIPGLSQLSLGWSGRAAAYQNDLPAGSQDLSRFEALQFRAAVNFEDTRNKKRKPQDFSVELVDGSGNIASVAVSDFSSALYYPPGGAPKTVLPRLLLNGVRIPLSAFTGISLRDIRSIRFKFDQKPRGAILISDIMLAGSPNLHQ